MSTFPFCRVCQHLIYPPGRPCLSCVPPIVSPQTVPQFDATPLQGRIGYQRAVVTSPISPALHRSLPHHMPIAAHQTHFSTISDHATQSAGSRTPARFPSTHCPRARTHVPSRRPGASNQAFINQAAPAHLRRRLQDILLSHWWRNNELEQHQELADLLEHDRPNEWRCVLGGCQRNEVTWSRKERAVDHIRRHLDHRPFKCADNACGNTACTLAFLSKRDLHSHLNPVSVDCERCGRTVKKRNLPRHQGSSCCRRVFRPPSS